MEAQDKREEYLESILWLHCPHADKVPADKRRGVMMLIPAFDNVVNYDEWTLRMGNEAKETSPTPATAGEANDAALEALDRMDFPGMERDDDGSGS